MNYPPPHAQPPLQPVKKKMSGCMLTLIISGSLFAVGAIGIGIATYVFLGSAQGKRAASLISEGVSITADSLNAPGAKEVRALGCAQGAVVDLDRLDALARAGNPDAAPSTEAREYRFAVTCQVSKLEGAPTCDQVASAYRVAASPTAPFAAVVTQSGSKSPHCSALYGADGQRIGDLK